MVTNEKPYRRPLLVAEIFDKAAESSGESMKFTGENASKIKSCKEKLK